MGKTVRVLIFVMVFSAGTFCLWYFGSKLSPASVRVTLETISNKWYAPLAFIPAYFMSSTTAIVAGIVFGFWSGFLVVLSAAALHALVAYGVSAIGGVKKRVKTIEDNFVNLLKIRLFPFFPNTLNWAFSIMKIQFKNYFLTSILGVTPRSVVYVLAGVSISDVIKGNPKLVSLIISGVLILLISLPSLSERIRQRLGLEIPEGKRTFPLKQEEGMVIEKR